MESKDFQSLSSIPLDRIRMLIEKLFVQDRMIERSFYFFYDTISIQYHFFFFQYWCKHIVRRWRRN